MYGNIFKELAVIYVVMLEEIVINGNTVYQDNISRKLDSKYKINKIKEFENVLGIVPDTKNIGRFIRIAQKVGHIAGLTAEGYDSYWKDDYTLGGRLGSLKEFGPFYEGMGFLRVAKLKGSKKVYFLTEAVIKAFLGELYYGPAHRDDFKDFFPSYGFVDFKQPKKLKK